MRGNQDDFSCHLQPSHIKQIFQQSDRKPIVQPESLFLENFPHTGGRASLLELKPFPGCGWCWDRRAQGGTNHTDQGCLPAALPVPIIFPKKGLAQALLWDISNWQTSLAETVLVLGLDSSPSFLPSLLRVTSDGGGKVFIFFYCLKHGNSYYGEGHKNPLVTQNQVLFTLAKGPDLKAHTPS